MTGHIEYILGRKAESGQGAGRCAMQLKKRVVKCSERVFHGKEFTRINVRMNAEVQPAQSENMRGARLL